VLAPLDGLPHAGSFMAKDEFEAPGASREDRLALRLRANLHRRKAQARALGNARRDQGRDPVNGEQSPRGSDS